MQETPKPGTANRSRLLDQVVRACRTRHDARKTGETYRAWVRDFLLFHRRRAGRFIHPGEMGGAEVEACLTYLAVERRVAAFSALAVRVIEAQPQRKLTYSEREPAVRLDQPRRHGPARLRPRRLRLPHRHRGVGRPRVHLRSLGPRRGLRSGPGPDRSVDQDAQGQLRLVSNCAAQSQHRPAGRCRAQRVISRGRCGVWACGM
ncbi:MAG: hypothetical protein GVY24_06260 [Planctomycetes bacterium]|nr:hypothetical protein [Planctomycetota bacterium]